MPERMHTYRVANRWMGNLGEGTAGYRSYSRNFEMLAAGKHAAVPCSADPHFRGDAARYNTEELLVGSLSGCHMLWVLHLCADARIVVTEYSDEATGEMTEHADGAGEFVRVTLHPRMTITDATRVDDAIALHQRAHELCFLARSMNFPVECEAVVSATEEGSVIDRSHGPW